MDLEITIVVVRLLRGLVVHIDGIQQIMQIYGDEKVQM